MTSEPDHDTTERVAATKNVDETKSPNESTSHSSSSSSGNQNFNDYKQTLSFFKFEI